MATPTIETKIWLALRARLEAFTPPTALSILWPGENVALPANTPALEVMFMPNRPQRQYLAGSEPSYRQGILQVGVMTLPGQPQHEAFARELAGDVADHFPPDVRMPYGGVVVRVQEAPTVGASFKDEARQRWVTPVTIRFHTEA